MDKVITNIQAHCSSAYGMVPSGVNYGQLIIVKNYALSQPERLCHHAVDNKLSTALVFQTANMGDEDKEHAICLECVAELAILQPSLNKLESLLQEHKK